MQTHWKQDTIKVDGADFFYTRTGEVSGKPAIVLAHGFSDYGMNWSPLARQLEDEYDVIMPDARGHGRSPRVQVGEIVDQAADLAGFIQALELKSPVVGGHSMGGYTAAAMGARFPGLARALILEDPAWFDAPPQRPAVTKEEKPNPFTEWLFNLPNMTIEEVMARGREQNPTWLEEEFYIWAESKKQLDLNFVRNRIRLPGDWRDTARKLTVPTLLITASRRKGGIITPKLSKEAREISSFIKVAHIPGVGHSIRRENGPAYLKAIKRFLNQL